MKKEKIQNIVEAADYLISVIIDGIIEDDKEETNDKG